MALHSLCIWCRAKVPYRTKRCPTCHAQYLQYQEQYKDKKIVDFRGSKWWKYKRRDVMKSSHYQCQICKHNGITNEAEEVHHIIPLSVDFDKRLDSNNLIALCEQCHDDVHDGMSIPPELLKDL